MTLSITTISLMTLSIMTFSIPINKSRHSAQWQNFVMLSVIMMNVTYKPVVLSVIRPIVVMLSVRGAFKLF